MRFARLPLLLSACLLAAGCSTLNSGNAGTAEDCSDCCCCNAQVAVTYSAPVVVERRAAPRHVERALRASPELPCAPGYCAPRKARRDRN